MISYERLFEIIYETECERCNNLYEVRSSCGYRCGSTEEECKECVMTSLDITEDEYNELFKELYKD